MSRPRLFFPQRLSGERGRPDRCGARLARHSGFFRRDAERCDRDGRAPQAMKFVALGEALGRHKELASGPIRMFSEAVD
jgi:hypothetical protein